MEFQGKGKEMGKGKKNLETFSKYEFNIDTPKNLGKKSALRHLKVLFDPVSFTFSIPSYFTP